MERKNKNTKKHYRNVRQESFTDHRRQGQRIRRQIEDAIVSSSVKNDKKTITHSSSDVSDVASTTIALTSRQRHLQQLEHLAKFPIERVTYCTLVQSVDNIPKKQLVEATFYKQQDTAKICTTDGRTAIVSISALRPLF